MTASYRNIQSGKGSPSRWASRRSRNACIPGANPRAVGLVRRLKVKVRMVVESPSRTSSQRMTASASPFGSCGCGAVCHSCSNTRGGSQTKMRPVVWNSAGPVTKSIVPPLRPFMTALLLNHSASSLGSVIAFQTTSRGCASRRSYLSVAYRPSIITSPLWLIAFIPFLLLCFWTGAAQVHQGCPTRTPCTWLSKHLVLPEPLAGGCISSVGHESERLQGRHL